MLFVAMNEASDNGLVSYPRGLTTAPLPEPPEGGGHRPEMEKVQEHPVLIIGGDAQYNYKMPNGAEGKPQKRLFAEKCAEK